MSHAVPNPSLAISDVDYVTKMQANLDYLRDLLMLQQLTGSELSSTAAIANAQVAQYGLAGSSLNTGASGVPTAAIVTGAVTESKYGAASIVDGDLDYTSVKFVRTGAAGIWIIRGLRDETITVSSGTPYNFTIDISTEADDYYGLTTIDQAFVFMNGSADPGKPYSVHVAPSGLTLSVTVYSVETISGYAAKFHWMCLGT